jgi:hypothetical protein
MALLAYLRSQYTKCYSAIWTCWFFTPFYLLSCIFPDVISRWLRQMDDVKFRANCGWSPTETLALIRQSFGEESMSRARKVTHRVKVETHQNRKSESGKVESKKHANNFPSHQGNFSQRIRLPVNAAYCCEVLMRLGENLRRLRLEIWQQTTTHLVTLSTSPRTIWPKTRRMCPPHSP